MVRLYAKAPVRIDFAGGSTDIYPFTKLGGAVLNAAINKYVFGAVIKKSDYTILRYHAHVPTSSGLGTSGVMNVVWLALATKFRDKTKLAELAYDIERATGVIGGKQDQYAGAFGGINFLQFNDKKVILEKLKLDERFIKELENKLFLYYTGPRTSSDFNQKILENIMKNDKKTINILKNTAINAKEMRRVLLDKDLNSFSDLLNREWEYRKSLHPNITTPKIERIIKFAKKNGADAAKACGAGGGGTILFYTDRKKSLMKKMGRNVINLKFDFEGLVIKER